MWQPEPVEAPTKAKRAVRSIGARNMRAAPKAWNALHEIAPQFPKVDVAEFRPVDFAYYFEVKTLDGETRFVDLMTAFEYFEKWKRRRLKNVEAVKKYRYEATEA